MSGYGQVLHGGCTMILSKKKLGGVSLSFLQTRSGREVVLETESIEARRFTSEQLGNEVGLDCSGRTVQRAMGTMSYHKCTACRKGWVNERLAERRVQYASTMLQRYPEPKDWQRVKFSNEVYFG